MEAATIEPTSTEPVEAAAQVTAQRMFRYSAFIDVGEGAADCEHSRDGECNDIEHFHAWCRLPNPYQNEDVRKKANAAKARKLRELRDPDSDASVILDESLAGLRDETSRDALIEELVSADWPKNYLEATRDVEEREEWEHVGQDREEYARLHPHESGLPEEERSEEYKRLIEHLDAYTIALRERIAEIEKPRRDQLAERSIDDLVALVRARRVEEEGTHAFMRTYEPWTWFVGTYKVAKHPTLGRPHLPMWEEIGSKDRPAAGTMYGEAPEVIDELERVFTELRVALQAGSAGN